MGGVVDWLRPVRCGASHIPSAGEARGTANETNGQSLISMPFSVMAGAWPDEGRAFVRTPYARPSTWFSLHATQMLGRQGGNSIGNRGAVGRRGWPGRPETLCSIATSSSRVSEGTFILPCFEGTFCNRIMQRESPITSMPPPVFQKS